MGTLRPKYIQGLGFRVHGALVGSKEANFAAILEDGSVISWGQFSVFRDDGSIFPEHRTLSGLLGFS